MDPADHIPFSQSDEKQVRSLTQWMGAVAIAHVIGALFFGVYTLFSFLGAAGMFAVGPVAGIVSVVHALVVLFLAALMLVEAYLIFAARSEFVGAADNFGAARSFVAKGLARLKILFMCEVAWFAGSMLISLFDVILFFVLPDQLEAGEQIGELIRQFGNQ